MTCVRSIAAFASSSGAATKTQLDLTAAIVEGRQPDHLSLTDLLEANIPMSWPEQAPLFEL